MVGLYKVEGPSERSPRMFARVVFPAFDGPTISNFNLLIFYWLLISNSNHKLTTISVSSQVLMRVVCACVCVYVCPSHWWLFVSLLLLLLPLSVLSHPIMISARVEWPLLRQRRQSWRKTRTRPLLLPSPSPSWTFEWLNNDVEHMSWTLMRWQFFFCSFLSSFHRFVSCKNKQTNK